MDPSEKKSIWKRDVGELFREKWQEFQQFAKTPAGKKKILLFSIIFIILLIFGIAIYNRYFAKEKLFGNLGQQTLPKMADENKEKVKKALSSLDGQMYPEDVANRHPLAIMVENHPEARPHSGLDKAKIIYEVITEGGITRFMAIYGPESSSKVGPVRSARSYFLDWTLEYDAFYAHVGGSSEALNLIPKLGIKDLNQFRYGNQAFWREPQKGKATEHTMYADTDKLWNIAQANGWNMKADFASFEFKDDLSKEHRPASQKVSINFSTNTYLVSWNYEPETNLYARNLAGLPHKDTISGEQLKTKNIIVQEVNRSYSPSDSNGGWSMQTTGSGKAKIYLDGKMIEASWKKEKRHSRTYFYDTDNKQIKFNPGVTWYEIVPPGTVVTTE